jgi:hypothetical protein
MGQVLELYIQRGQHGEIIIVKNNLITDALYAQITLSDITNFEKVKLINSMLGFEGSENPVSLIEI